MLNRGSPPRMRGKAQSHGVENAIDRITPAYAGKRRPALPLWRCGKDHPRVCGEKHRARRGSARAVGSPPRMRGKVPVLVIHKAENGITPAYAGKRPWARPSRRSPRDHPRACGEKDDLFTMLMQRQGSPPRMRGKVLGLKGGNVVVGITPAHAGKRSKGCPGWQFLGDHPRACGEKLI